MFNNWSVGRRLFAGFGLAGLTLLLIVFVSYRSITRLIENDAMVDNSHQVRTSLALLLSEMKDAETGQRGYLLTGNEGYLEPHETAVREVKGTLGELRRLTAGQSAPAASPGAALGSTLIDSKFAELKQTIDLRRGPGL